MDDVSSELMSTMMALGFLSRLDTGSVGAGVRGFVLPGGLYAEFGHSGREVEATQANGCCGSGSLSSISGRA